MFGVWCVVSGGVTGHREAWLKDDGKLMTFATQEAAQQHAQALMANISHSLSRATFSYTARAF